MCQSFVNVLGNITPNYSRESGQVWIWALLCILLTLHFYSFEYLYYEIIHHDQFAPVEVIKLKRMVSSNPKFLRHFLPKFLPPMALPKSEKNHKSKIKV